MCVCIHTSFVAQLVKNLPAMHKSWVQSLSWEDPLEKGKATHVYTHTHTHTHTHMCVYTDLEQKNCLINQFKA